MGRDKSLLKKVMADGAAGAGAPVMAGLPGDDNGHGRSGAPGPPAEGPAGQPRATVLRVDRNGIVLEANETGRSLLEILGREMGERLPDYITQLIPGILLSGISEKAVFECGGAPLAFTIALSDAPEVERLIRSDSPRRALVLVDSPESEASLLHALPVALYTSRKAREFGESWMSPGVQELTGFPPSQFTSSPRFWISRIHPKDRPGVLRELGGLADRGKASLEYRFQCAGGTYKWIMDQVVLVPGVMEVFGIMQDIDSRKLCERGLRDSNEFLEMLVDGEAHGVMVLDEDKNILFISPHFARKLGQRASHWVKKRTKIVFHPKDTRTGQATFSEALKGVPGQCTVRIRNLNLTYRNVHLFLSPLNWRGK